MAPWMRAILVVLALAPIAFMIYTFVFMAENEAAFDEELCPYEPVETREVTAAISVREDRRVCQPEVEEHRWTLLREGAAEVPLGLRRLDAALYEDYEWTATVNAEGLVHLEIHNGDADVRVFNEHPPGDAP